MRPVAIFRHSPTEGPGYFASFLEAHQIPWTLLPIDAGAVVPADAAAYSGLCFMGGPMSVNDPLPWIDPVCALIRDAVAWDIPVIGHCLGGQLMSKALGGQVSRNPVKEIGWSTVHAAQGEQDEDAAVIRHWLGQQASRPATVFQWHGETFSLPAGATLLLHNAACLHQAFVHGPHLAMQCHVEMIPEMIATWCEQWAEEAAAVAHLPSVQSPDTMQAEIPARLPVMRELAGQLYSVWLAGVRAAAARAANT